MLLRQAWYSVALVTGSLVLAAPAIAQTQGSNSPVFSWNKGDLTVTGNLTAALASVNHLNSSFGAGSYNLSYERTHTDISALEWFAKPQLVGLYDPGPYSVYGRVSAGVAGTEFGGDGNFPISATANHPREAKLEEALVGLRSGYSFSNWGISDSPDIFDVSYGRQDFYVGDGFLIGSKGSAQGGKLGAFWAGLRTAYEKVALLRVNTKPIRFDVFDVRSNANQDAQYAGIIGDYPKFELLGGTIEAYGDSIHDGVVKKDWVYGLTVMHIRDADENTSFGANNTTYVDPVSGLNTVPGATAGATRKGMDIISLRAQGRLIPSLPDLFLSGEFVYEHNGSNDQITGDNGTFGRKLEAKAYYLEAAYSWSGVFDWQIHPKVGYRYAHFDGQDPNATKSTSFDPLTYGYSYAPSRNVYGTWYMGEIIGENYLFNTNENVNMLYFNAYSGEFTYSLFLYRFDFDQLPFSSMTSRSAFEEADFEVDWYPTAHPWLGVTGILGIAKAERGGKQWIDATISQNVYSSSPNPYPPGDYQGLAEFLVTMTF